METILKDKKIEIFTNDYQTINYYRRISLLEYIWKDTDDMTEEDFKDNLYQQVEILKDFPVKIELFDTTKFTFPITPVLQEWTNEEIYTMKHTLGVEQFILIVSEDFIAQLSLEQATKENQANNFNPKFFTNKEEAFNFADSLKV